ncbi:MAG TPA: galactofuranose ABC transporter, permease protein YjfF [Kineosporiaceae bacterium]
MTLPVPEVVGSARSRRLRLPRSWVPVVATLVLLVIMYSVGVARYPAFSDPQVILNVFIDNGFLLVVAVGMTFVILTGGIDLSVGSVVALTTIVTASLLRDGWPAGVVAVLVLLMGSTLGLAMGCMIHFFEIQPFVVTLAGMFLARGLCYTISTSAITIDNGFWTTMANSRIAVAGYHVSPSVLIALAVLIVGGVVLASTPFGRSVYAIGGSAQSALLMGLALGRTRIAVYTISGFCSALGGILITFYEASGDPLRGIGLELDAIAAVVIGGTLLTGGSGYLIGTVFGVLVLGLIQTVINFEGTLSSWWTKIVIGILLLAFILLQRVVGLRGAPVLPRR